jgi:hypothetical protein
VARGGPDLQRFLTFGGQAPAAVGLLVGLMLLATVGATAWPPLGELLELRTARLDASGWLVLLEAWRLVTWPFYEGPLPASLLTLFFGGFMLLWLGRQLSYAWSERRFLRRFLAISVGSGLVTLLVLGPTGLGLTFSGIWAPVNGLLFTWGLLFPGQRINWFGALEMRGATLAWVLAIGTPAWALLLGPPGAGLIGRLAAYLPHLAALGVAWVLLGGGPGRLWTRGRSWLQRRRLARAKSRFQVIDPQGPGTPPRYWN